MEFEAAPSHGALVGGLLLAALLAFQGALVVAAVRLGLGPPAAVLMVLDVALLPLTVRLALWWWGCLSLSYSVSRDGVVIHWGASQQVVPMDAITHVLNGRPYARRLEGLHWPGHEVGRTAVATDDEAMHDTLVFATRPPAEQLLLVTPGLAYAISPADRSAFLEEFKVRRRIGPVQRLSGGTDQAGWLRLPIWRDTPALRLVLAALVLNVFAFAWLMWHYPAIPPDIPLQYTYNATQHAAVAGPLRPKDAVWLLPVIGLVATFGNSLLAMTVHQRARVAALLLLVGSVLLQLALAVMLKQIA
jgi:hypothetical protein